jgi:exosortase K
VKTRTRRPGPFGPGIKLAVVAAAILIAWCLKRHYSDARADELWWILSPTAHSVGVVTGATFAFQPGEGFFARDRLFLIEKSCAGINFMVAAFGMLVFALFHRVTSAATAVRVLGVSLMVSYLAAIAVNTARIAIAMWLAAHPAALPVFNAADIHRLEGIIVYFGGLVLLYEFVQWLDRPVAVVGRVPLDPAPHW